MRLTLHHSWPLPQKIFAKSLQFSVIFFFSLMILCYLCTHIYNRYYPMAKIKVHNTEITIVSHNDDDYISLTDMARSQLQEHIIFRWLSLKNTIEYLGEWEMLYNPNFNCTEFGTFRNMAGQQKESYPKSTTIFILMLSKAI